MSDIWLALDVLARSALIALTVLSFAPQVYRLLSKRTLEGISSSKVSFDQLVATYLFSMSILTVYGTLRNDPTSARNVLDIVQFATIWVGYSVVFCLRLILPPFDNFSALRRFALLCGHLLFAWIFLLPMVYGVGIPDDRDDDWARWVLAMFWGVTTALMISAAPFIIILEFGALSVQVSETKLRQSVGSLSVDGLFVQAVVFLVLGISMVFRMRVPDALWRGDPSLPPEDNTSLVKLWRLFFDWLVLVAWATINPLILAFTQGYLWRVCRRKCQAMETGENEPLLEHVDGPAVTTYTAADCRAES